MMKSYDLYVKQFFDALELYRQYCMDQMEVVKALCSDQELQNGAELAECLLAKKNEVLMWMKHRAWYVKRSGYEDRDADLKELIKRFASHIDINKVVNLTWESAKLRISLDALADFRGKEKLQAA